MWCKRSYQINRTDWRTERNHCLTCLVLFRFFVVNWECLLHVPEKDLEKLKMIKWRSCCSKVQGWIGAITLYQLWHHAGEPLKVHSGWNLRTEDWGWTMDHVSEIMNTNPRTWCLKTVIGFSRILGNLTCCCLFFCSSRIRSVYLSHIHIKAQWNYFLHISQLVTPGTDMIFLSIVIVTVSD